MIKTTLIFSQHSSVMPAVKACNCKSRVNLNMHRNSNGIELGNCLMTDSVSPPLTFRFKVICWESLMHSLQSEFLFPYNITSKEFQGQCNERSQPLTSSNQIYSEFWQQYIRQESFTSHYRQLKESLYWHYFKVVTMIWFGTLESFSGLQDLLPHWRVYIAVAVITFF